MRLILMGTGTSHGIPVIGCDCNVCASSDPRDRRYRCSAYILHNAARVVVDVGPEFRLQALQNQITHLDAVLLTHSHADHLHGLDDLRIFSHTKPCSCDSNQFPETAGAGLAVYANETTLHDIYDRFAYMFRPITEGGGVAKLAFKDCASFSPKAPLVIDGLRILPVPMRHGSIEATGWLFSCEEADGTHSIAYLTDCSAIPQDSLDCIRAYGGTLDHLVIDGLRIKPHSTHFSFDEALSCADQLAPRHAWLTHINHDLPHVEIQAYIDGRLAFYPSLAEAVQNGGSVSPAYDQLELRTSA